MTATEKCIIVGVTGGIAAYKSCELVSRLKKKGYEVHVLMSAHAREFVSPLTFQTLSGQRVITDMFETDYEPDVHHISLAKKADLFVIAPATANMIAKAAYGLADDMLSTTFLAASCPKLIVPAMNSAMLANPATQENLQKCRSHGIAVMDSASGFLACGDTGKGRMPEPEEIEDRIEEMLAEKYLSGKKILISAGPTQEALDPVRYLTNHSSGRMGYALAKAARNAGAQVTLVAGPNDLPAVAGVETVPVVSAGDMAQAVLDRSAGMDAVIMAAAVADFTPVKTAREKIKKHGDGLTLELQSTEDILKELGAQKKKGQVLIGFAMETEDLLANAEKKRKAKHCDYILANSIREPGAGFQGDTNHVTILSAKGRKDLGMRSKQETAEQILAYCLKGKKASR